VSQTKEEVNKLLVDKVCPGRKNLALGLYLHVPFCSTTCDFCAFYQEKPSKKGISDYFSGLKLEFERFSPDRPLSTIFIGGGTPGLLSADQLFELCTMIGSLDHETGVEWSIELAPSEINPEKLEVLRQGEVNRISLGVQTFDPRFMDALGRRHPVEKVRQAYQWIRQVGFSSVNIDLLFGAPGQSIEDWENDLEQAIELQPDHLSTYCLTFEEDTAMYLRLAEGKVRIDPEREAEFYEFAWDYLPRHGYDQYEVSNYAKSGNTCRHNLNTWGMNEWLGYGPSACTQYFGVRRKNVPDITRWLASLQPGKESEFVEEQFLSSMNLAEDALLFGLRMNQGINIGSIATRFSLQISAFKDVVSFFERLVDEGLAESPSEYAYRLTRAGRIVADAVASEMPDLTA
jgi:oxygen-independent coproporphyrinogen-3 oxidase